MCTLNSYPKKKTPGSYGFTGELYTTLKEDIIQNLYNFSQITEEEKHFPIHLWGQHYPDTTPEKNSTKDKITDQYPS